jgi:hypothetical protein
MLQDRFHFRFLNQFSSDPTFTFPYCKNRFIIQVLLYNFREIGRSMEIRYLTFGKRTDDVGFALFTGHEGLTERRGTELLCF